MRRRRAQTEAFSLFSFQDIITSVTGVIILVTLLLAVELVKRPPVQDAKPRKSVTEELRSQIAAFGREQDLLNKLLQEDAEFLRGSASLSMSDLERTQAEMARRVDETEKATEALTDAMKESIARRAAAESELSITESQSLAQIQAENAALAAELEVVKSSNQVVYNKNPGSQKAAWLVDLQADCIRVLKPGDEDVQLEFDESDEAERVVAFVKWAKTRDRRNDYFVLLVRPESIDAYQALYEGLRELEYDLGFDLLATDSEVTVASPSRRAGK